MAIYEAETPDDDDGVPRCDIVTFRAEPLDAFGLVVAPNTPAASLTWCISLSSRTPRCSVLAMALSLVGCTGEDIEDSDGDVLSERDDASLRFP